MAGVHPHRLDAGRPGVGFRWRARRIVALLGGTTAVTACSGDHHVFDGSGDGASRIGAIGWFMIVTSTLIAVVFLALLGWALLRGGTRRFRLPERGTVVIGGIFVPTVVIVALTALSLNALNGEASPGAVRVEVIGHQYWWEVRYPDAGVTTANEIQIPVDQPVDIELTSADVIHSFWVPSLDGKIDMIPGQTNHLTVTAHQLGTFRGQCAEFCGIQHAQMAFLVQVSSRDDFESWLTERGRPAAEPTTDSARAGRDDFERLPCASCHTIEGTAAQGKVGPDLTHLASRPTLGAGAVPNNRGELGGWIANSQTIKPGNLMPPVPMTPDELQHVLDYLGGLR